MRLLGVEPRNRKKESFSSLFFSPLRLDQDDRRVDRDSLCRDGGAHGRDGESHGREVDGRRVEVDAGDGVAEVFF